MSPLQNCKSNSFMASSVRFWFVILINDHPLICFITRLVLGFLIQPLFFFFSLWMCFTICRMTEEATSGNPWAPDSRTLRSISRAAFELDDYWRIVEILHRRFFRVPLVCLGMFPNLVSIYPSWMNDCYKFKTGSWNSKRRIGGSLTIPWSCLSTCWLKDQRVLLRNLRVTKMSSARWKVFSILMTLGKWVCSYFCISCRKTCSC